MTPCAEASPSSTRVSSATPRRGHTARLTCWCDPMCCWSFSLTPCLRKLRPFRRRTSATRAGTTACWTASLTEQSHRGVKQRYYPMRGFGNFESASRFCAAFEELQQYFRVRRRGETTSSSRRWSGLTGTTTVDCTAPSATCRPPSTRPASTARPSRRGPGLNEPSLHQTRGGSPCARSIAAALAPQVDRPLPARVRSICSRA